jgi:hypothetical protein
LGETGHGLIESNREAEITTGTAIHNVWCMYIGFRVLNVQAFTNRRTDKIETKFKWYKRLHALLSSSPVYDLSGLVNSTTPVNLNILSQGGKPDEELEVKGPKARNDDVSILYLFNRSICN